MKLLPWLADTFERGASTFIQLGLTLVIGGQALDISFAHQMATAGIAAFFVVVLNALPSLNFTFAPDSLQDTLARASKSFLQAMLAVVVAAGSGWISVTMWQTALVAGVVAAASIVKTWLASKMKSPTLTPGSVVRLPVRFEPKTEALAA